ncbi:UNVERIFIED_CONTAM: hypothetical protein GTU68_051345 [Idotea baltica]|nr:hypothetical protein [Idotea baltica]
MTGLLLASYVAKRIYIKENIPVKNLEKLFFYIIIGIVLGARLGHCFFYEPSYYFQNPIEILLPIQKGLASHGGAIGALIAIGIYCKKFNTNFLWILDKIAIATPIVAIFIRLGNFMNSEIYGKPTNGYWGVIFQRDDLIPRHPTQLYEAFSYLLIFGILLFTYKKMATKLFNGQIFGLLLVSVFSARFIIEFFKENQVAFEDAMSINMGQILSIPFILVGLTLILRKKIQQTK